MDTVDLFLGAPETTGPGEVVILLANMRVHTQQPAFRTANFTEALVTRIAVALVTFGNRYADQENVTLSVLQVSNSLSLEVIGRRIIVETNLDTVAANALKRHIHSLVICYDAGLVLKNLGSEPSHRPLVGPVCLHPLVCALVSWYPPGPEQPYTVVLALAEAIRMLQAGVPGNLLVLQGSLLYALKHLCFCSLSLEAILPLLVDATLDRTRVTVKDVKLVAVAIDNFAASSTTYSFGFFTIANLLMSDSIRAEMTAKVLMTVVRVVKKGVELFPTVGPVLLGGLKTLHHCSIAPPLRHGLQSQGAWVPVLTALRAPYVTTGEAYLGLVLAIPSPLDVIQRIALCCLAQMGLDPKNRADVHDDVIQLLAQLQADPARVNEGCAMIVGEAVGAYTRDAPPATLARFQAAMAAAMEADDDD